MCKYERMNPEHLSLFWLFWAEKLLIFYYLFFFLIISIRKLINFTYLYENILVWKNYCYVSFLVVCIHLMGNGMGQSIHIIDTFHTCSTINNLWDCFVFFGPVWCICVCVCVCIWEGAAKLPHRFYQGKNFANIIFILTKIQFWKGI